MRTTAELRHEVTGLDCQPDKAATAKWPQKVADRLYQTSLIKLCLEKSPAVIRHNHAEEFKSLCYEELEEVNHLSYFMYIFEQTDLVTFSEDL